MKYYSLRVNKSLHTCVLVDGKPREIEYVRFARSFAPPPINSILDDMELQHNPDKPSYRDIPAFCDVCDDWLDDCECPDIEKSVYG